MAPARPRRSPSVKLSSTKKISSDTPIRISGIAIGASTRIGSSRELVAVHRHAGHRSQHRRDEARASVAIEQRVAGGRQHVLVVERACRYQSEREADPLGVQARIVERVDDDDQPAARRGTRSRPAPPPTASDRGVYARAASALDGVPRLRAADPRRERRRAPAPRRSARSTARCRTASRASPGTAA